MNPAKHTAIISPIKAKLKEYDAAVAERAKDQTLQAARDALAAAEAAKERADIEDESVSPEDLVDQRLEAARQIEIAKVRLARAVKASGEEWDSTLEPLHQARALASKALFEAADVNVARLRDGVMKVVGDEIFNAIKGEFKSALYRRQSQFLGLARRLEGGGMETNHTIQSIQSAFTMIEEAYQDA